MNYQTIYHYTNPDGWNGIVNGQKDYLVKHPLTNKLVDSESVKGWMLPHRRLISEGIESSLVPNEATSPAIFGLLEPIPISWIQYRDSSCESIWNYLLSCCKRGREKIVLLKLNLLSEDNPQVFDYVHIRRTAKNLREMKYTEEYRRTMAEGNKIYWDSRVKLEDYEGNFVLPEIVVFSPIPIERIEFVKEQDLSLLTI